MGRCGDQHRVYRDQHATTKRGIRERWTSTTGQDHPIPKEGQRFPPVQVERANVHGYILVQQVPPFYSERGHFIIQDAQYGAGPHGIARHRRVLVHLETYAKNLKHMVFKGKLCGYRYNSK